MTTPHVCKGLLPAGCYGDAISRCEASPDGVLWIDNGEYTNAVRFCPYCGFRGAWHFGPFRELRTGQQGGTEGNVFHDPGWWRAVAAGRIQQ